MLRALKRDQRLIDPQRLPVSLRGSPITGVRQKSVNELVMSPVLRRLIRVTRAWSNSRRAQQRQSQRIVIRLVRTVLAIGKDGDATRAAAIREIEPLMRRHFKLALVVIAALDRSDVPIVSRLIVCGSERKSGLEIGVRSLPVDHVAEL